MNAPLSSFKYFQHREDYLSWLADASVQHLRRSAESQTVDQIAAADDVGFYCWAHRGPGKLSYSDLGRSEHGYNWREFGHCSECEAITRIRLVAECIDRASSNYLKPTIYLTEQLTPLYKLLRQHHANLIGSEFVPDAALRREAHQRLQSYLDDSAATLRHEDGCALTFADESIHIIGSFDVLEHIPDYQQAIREFVRVLRPGGQLFLTAPFLPASETTLVRAQLDPTADNGIRHLLPPEYHGNPTDPSGGALCFYHFGWDLLSELRRQGFRAVALADAWSQETAVFGNQQVIVATR
jgi:SAM-dependent methyltransferase